MLVFGEGEGEGEGGGSMCSGELPLELGSDGKSSSSSPLALGSASTSDGREVERRPGFSESRRWTLTPVVSLPFPRLRSFGRSTFCAMGAW